MKILNSKIKKEKGPKRNIRKGPTHEMCLSRLAEESRSGSIESQWHKRKVNRRLNLIAVSLHFLLDDREKRVVMKTRVNLSRSYVATAKSRADGKEHLVPFWPIRMVGVSLLLSNIEVWTPLGIPATSQFSFYITRLHLPAHELTHELWLCTFADSVEKSQNLPSSFLIDFRHNTYHGGFLSRCNLIPSEHFAQISLCSKPSILCHKSQETALAVSWKEYYENFSFLLLQNMVSAGGGQASRCFNVA